MNIGSHTLDSEVVIWSY